MKQKTRLKLLIISGLLLIIVVKISVRGLRSSEDVIFEKNKMHSHLVEILQNHVRMLSDEIGDRSIFDIRKLRESASYIAGKFHEYGYDVQKHQYTAWKETVENIIVEKEGIDWPDEIILVGAHYDSCANPGADDNASAVAGLLELADLLKDENLSRTIRFVAFVNEEPPFFATDLMGSYVYAHEVRKKNEKIQAAIILEMIGYYSDEPDSQEYPPLLGLFYPNKGNFITIVSNLKYRRLAGEICKSFRRHSSFPIEVLSAPSSLAGVDFSDHRSFWKVGYPAVMVTDTAFYRNKNYHKSTDTYDTLDYDSMAAVVSGLSQVLIEMANKP